MNLAGLFTLLVLRRRSLGNTYWTTSWIWKQPRVSLAKFTLKGYRSFLAFRSLTDGQDFISGENRPVGHQNSVTAAAPLKTLAGASPNKVSSLGLTWELHGKEENSRGSYLGQNQRREGFSVRADFVGAELGVL